MWAAFLAAFILLAIVRLLMSGSSQSAFSSSGSSSSQPSTGGGGGGAPAVDESLLWATPYVVSTDPDAPFQTIQAALVQVAADNPAFAGILVETGLWVEDLDFSVLTGIGTALVAIKPIAGRITIQGVTGINPGVNLDLRFENCVFRTGFGLASVQVSTNCAVEMRDCETEDGMTVLQDPLEQQPIEVTLRRCSHDGPFSAAALVVDGGLIRAYECSFSTNALAFGAVRLIETGTAETDFFGEGCFFSAADPGSPDFTGVIQAEGANVTLVGQATGQSSNCEAQNRPAISATSGQIVVQDGVILRALGQAIIYVTDGANVEVQRSTLESFSNTNAIFVSAVPAVMTVVDSEVRAGTTPPVTPEDFTFGSDVAGCILAYSTLYGAPITYPSATFAPATDIEQVPTGVP